MAQYYFGRCVQRCRNASVGTILATAVNGPCMTDRRFDGLIAIDIWSGRASGTALERPGIEGVTQWSFGTSRSSAVAARSDALLESGRVMPRLAPTFAQSR